jgi:hypothetical protein
MTTHQKNILKTKYVSRPSQITRKAPSSRLKKRRTKNISAGPETAGYFPNPAKKAGYKVKIGSVIYATTTSLEKAKDVGQALADMLKKPISIHRS